MDGSAGGGAQTSASSETTLSAEGHSQDDASGDASNAWFLIDGGSSNAKYSAGSDERFDVSALVRGETSVAALKPQSSAAVAAAANFTTMAPSIAVTTDSTDYDADDDVNTEPSSIKSGFENDNSAGGMVMGSEGVDGVADDGGFDLVASTLIRIESPNSSKSAKKKKKR